MAIPASTFIWPESMDPSDVVDFQIDCTSVLETGESIASFTFTANADATLLGLTVGTGASAPAISGNIVTVWLSVSDTYKDNIAFDGVGVTLPLTLTITTNSTPPRKKQRTVAVMVAQK